MEVLKETVSNVYTRDLDFLLRRSTNENTPALVLDGQIQSRKGSYPGSVGLHPLQVLQSPISPGSEGGDCPARSLETKTQTKVISRNRWQLRQSETATNGRDLRISGQNEFLPG